jgi:hypothetical protein
MDSDTEAHKQIDNLTEEDLNRLTEEHVNTTILLEERVEMLQKQVNYLQLVIRKYGKENKS